ncbi:FMN-dependent NADH-azoreductase [Sphingomonas zeicaulis]|uniref:FMN-dependent NADH-azoreductase n=1 Tax=Sphingomonas zeicaulis TaxID=1632740 RepID=UPI003D23EA7F
MTRTLLINASPYGDASRGYRFARQVCAAMLGANPAATLVERDLSLLAEPVLPLAYVEAILGQRPHDDPAFALSETLIREIEQTDRLVIATPMHNFAVPASLKLWIDYTLRFGRSFGSEGGNKFGLLQDRPTLVVVTSGGIVSHQSALQPDLLTGYLRDVLLTMGIADLRFLHLEGTARQGMAEAIIDDAWERLRTDPVFGDRIEA